MFVIMITALKQPAGQCLCEERQGIFHESHGGDGNGVPEVTIELSLINFTNIN